MTLSVIIPIYNSEKYIDKCLSSLLNQSFQDFEIIVIDDGSSDNSRQKADEILKGRHNCTIISKDNAGVSAARNSGLLLAKGEWITFVDSDDYLAPDFLEKMIHFSSYCDLLVSGIIFMKGEKEFRRYLPPNDEWGVNDLKQGKASYLDYMASSVGRFFRRNIIENNKLHFDESLITSEDRDFNIEYISKTGKNRFINYAGYYYQTAHEMSLSKRYSSDRLRRSILYWNKMYRLLDGTNERYLAHRLYYFITDVVSDHLQRKDFPCAVKALCEVRPLFDRSFLRRNLKGIKAPAWQKALVRIYLG